MVPQQEPEQGLAVAPGTWALQSPLLLWISYLLPGPPLPPLPLVLLHSSSTDKSKKGTTPNGNFSNEQDSQAIDHSGTGGGAVTLFLRKEWLTEPTGLVI